MQVHDTLILYVGRPRNVFDSISREAIEETLMGMGFSDEVRKILSQCYRTLTFLILVDGEPSARFVSQRELRQGDPISPPFFILTMENLTQMNSYKTWGIDSISNLLFANNILIFDQVNKISLGEVRNALDVFQRFTGMVFNESKHGVVYLGLSTHLMGIQCKNQQLAPVKGTA